MKITEQLSIGGYAFTVEKDAAAALQEYIGTLESHYLAQEGGKEIMDGIEERVAELLLDKAGRGGVVTRDHVNAVIAIVGRPERIEADDPGPETSAKENHSRRLFRDLEDKRLGGVILDRGIEQGFVGIRGDADATGQKRHLRHGRLHTERAV